MGAGFSAPLGLPVMGDFLVKSKDMYFDNPNRFTYFKQVFDLIKRMSVTKNYYRTDLLNIEEILSILEMQSFLGKRKLRKIFLKYIAEVVNFFTPAVTPCTAPLPAKWHQHVFGSDSQWRKYGIFFANLMRMSISRENNFVVGEPRYRFRISQNSRHSYQYSIVTLNYDYVPEIFAEFCTAQYEPTVPVEFRKQVTGDLWEVPSLAKLHGCAREGNIIPPTWSKGVYRSIIPTWRLAYQLLVDANYIRFVGYSLRAADLYIQYLLKAASLTATHLKMVDVICLDPDGSVYSRFKEFIDFSFFRFANARTEDYLDSLESAYNKTSNNVEVRHLVEFTQLEHVHDEFMRQAQQGRQLGRSP
jgi:hypothetical protein